MASPSPTPKPRTASSSSGGVSRVRGAAAMWENKLSPTTGNASPGSSPTTSRAPRKPKVDTKAAAKVGSKDSTTGTGRVRAAASASSPNSATKAGSSPRTLTPPSAFKAEGKKQGASRSRSGSVSARASSPVAVAASSPPPVPPVPVLLATAPDEEADAGAEKPSELSTSPAGLEVESADLDSYYSADEDHASRADREEANELRPAFENRGPDNALKAGRDTDLADESLDDVTLDDVALARTALEDVKLDDIELGESPEAASPVSRKKPSELALDSPMLDDLDDVQLDSEPSATEPRRTVEPSPVDFSLPASVPIPVPAPDPVDASDAPDDLPPLPTKDEIASHSPGRLGPGTSGDSTAAELDVADLPRRSTSRPRTPPGDRLSPEKHADAAAQAPTTPARNAFQSFFGRGKSASTEVDIGDAQADELATPPASGAKDRSAPPSATGKSFFSSATSAFSGIQLPSVSLPSVSMPAATTSRSNSQHTPPTESTATLQPVGSPPVSTSPGPSWRTTMSHFLQRGTSPQPTTPPPVPVRNGSSSGAALLMKRFESPSALRDRRISHEAGGSNQLREGFERVRNEMEGAARDIRRERAGRGESIDSDVDWTFWGAVVQDYEEVARTRPKDLSRAIQQGIPAVIRGPIWQLMSSSKSSELEETYKALLKLTSPHEKAIMKDITRTFPNHKFFQGVGAGQDGLFMVVKAYSLYDQEVGYTQGIAFVVAALLLNMPDEEAFCVLVRLMDSYNLRSHYLADMPGLQLRLYQFDRLVEDVLPLLHTHLVRKGIKSSMFASQWFMTLFSYRFPLELVYRVLDIVLAEGIEAIFRFALALLQKAEDDLLPLEFEEILAYLQGDLYEVYRAHEESGDGTEPESEPEWRANDFVRDAYAIRITPLMLDQYESEWAERCRAQSAHSRELDQLRSANRHLSGQVKTLEASLATMNSEHVELVRQLVLAKIAKEDMETELVRYKSMCAQLAQGREEEVDPTLASRGSEASLSASLAPQTSPRRSRRGSESVLSVSDEGGRGEGAQAM